MLEGLFARFYKLLVNTNLMEDWSEFFSGEDFIKERFEEIFSKVLTSYKMLADASNGKDALLKLASFEAGSQENTLAFKIGDVQEFIKNLGLNETKLPDPKMYHALKKYHAMMCAKIRFRERGSLDSSIQGLVEYADLLSGQIYGKPSVYSSFIDFTTHPAKILPIFREYSEITESELEKVCKEKQCSNRNDILVNMFINLAQKEVKRLEEKLFIH